MKKMLKMFSLLFVVLLFMKTASAQLNSVGVFPTIDLSGALAEKWSYNAYLFDAIRLSSNQEAESDARSRFAYVELGVSYAITDKLSFTGAYVYEWKNVSQQFRAADYEHRFFQQLTLKLPYESVVFKHRLRYDERFVHNKITDESPYTHRLRYLLGIAVPINEQFYLFGYSEMYFDTKSNFNFNENWSALQLGYKLNKTNAIEAGLLYIGWIGDRPQNNDNQYYLQLTWVSNVDFFSKN